MKDYAIIVILSIFATRTFSQPIEKRTADSLLVVLNKTLPGVERIDLLLHLAQYHIHKPGELQADFDSATVYIDEATILNKSVKSSAARGFQLLTESYLTKEQGRKEEARRMVEKAVKILQSDSNRLYLGSAYFELSGYYSYSDRKELAERIRLMELALNCFQQIGNTERSASSHYALGDLCFLNYEYAKALKHLKLSLDGYRLVNHAAVQGVYILMGTAYGFQGDNKQALDYGLLALKTAENVGDTSFQLCQINNAIARTLVRLNDRQKAIYYFNNALSVAEKYNDRSSIYVVGTNLALNWANLGDPKRALRIVKEISAKYEKPNETNVNFNLLRCYILSFTLLKQYASAQPYCDQLLEMFDNVGIGEFGMIEVYAVAINFYISSGQHELAIRYLKKHKELSEKVADLSLRAANHKLWFALDTARHNYHAAVAHLQNYIRLNDSLYNETKSKQIAELQIQFETEKKEKDILVKGQQIAVLTKERQLKDMNLERLRFIKNATLYGSLLLLVTGVIFYRQYRRKQRDSDTISRMNKQLQHSLTEKEWLIKEVHHRVKNNLHTVICLLESQAVYLEKDALQAIEKSQHRIYAMSLIHQKLYQNDDLSTIDMSIYLEELIGYLKDSFDAQRIDFKLNVEPVHLNLQQAIPVALIINEGVTNAIKYAFSGISLPAVLISMSQTTEMVKLVISDNGSGFELKEEDEGKSLGMQLIRGLSKELKGRVQIDTIRGTTLTIEFQKESITDQIPVTQEDSV
ncbi:MAG TPA: histidine kinase dimerization/phosphoacceptor domain -containing protein [Chryseolinea sp.]|nr:histidine kinase dimerization/phosphoacceptor domain -containing protein [Chryseolinea sp.]